MTDLIHNCDDAALLAESNGCSVYQFRNETGEGVMTVYKVFPGVTLSYNDFHMEYYDSVFHPRKGGLLHRPLPGGTAGIYCKR